MSHFNVAHTLPVPMKVRICNDIIPSCLSPYSKVIVGNLILCQGDFVLIRNEDTKDTGDDDDLECDVAQILHLYENLDPDIKDDPCRAIVQWYSR